MRFAKNQAKAKQHPEAELLLLRNYSLSPSTLWSKKIRHIVKQKQVRLFSCDHVINYNENEVENEK